MRIGVGAAIPYGFGRLLGSSGWLLAGNVVALALGFIQLVVVARVLGPASYGLLALMTTYAITVNQLVDSRSWETATTYLARYRAEGDRARAVSLVKLCYLLDAGTALTALVLVAGTSGLAARLLLRDPTLAPLIVVYAAVIVASAPVGASLALARVAGRFDWVATYHAGSAAARLGAVLIALTVADTLQSVVAAHAVAATVVGFASLVLGRRSARLLGLSGLRRAPLATLRGELRDIIWFLSLSNASALLKMLQRHADVLIVGYLMTPASAGFVRLARSFADLINAPVVPIYEAGLPAFSDLAAKGERVELRRLASRVTATCALAGAAGLVIIALAAAALVRSLAGEAYAPAVPLVRLFALGMAIGVATSAWHPLLLVVRRPAQSLIALALGTAVQLAALVVLLPVLGLPAAGLAFIGFYLVWTLVVGRSLARIMFDG